MFTTAKANSILNDVFKGSPEGASGTDFVYIGLSSTEPSEDGTNFTEPEASSATGYHRGEIGSKMGNASNRQIQNTSVCYMSLLRTDLGPVGYFGLFTTKTGGEPFFCGPLTTEINLSVDHIPVVDIGGLVVGLDKETLEPGKTWDEI